MIRRCLAVVGDVMLDRDVEGEVHRVSPDAPVPVLDETASRVRPGGAALAAMLAASDGHPVVLVTALADDDAGRSLQRLLADAGVEVLAARSHGATPEKIRYRAEGHPLMRLDRGGAPGPAGPLPERAVAALRDAGVVLVSDYGRGAAARDDVRAAVAARRLPTVWDPHPRGPAPMAGMSLVTPNRSELERAVPGGDGEADGTDVLGATVRRARAARRIWEVQAVAVTLGRLGAVLVDGDGPPMAVPAQPESGDPCGAGDRFASAVATALLGGASRPDAVATAVGVAGRFVAAGGAAAVTQPAPAASAPPAPNPGADAAPHPGAAATPHPGAGATLHPGAVGPRPPGAGAPPPPRRQAADVAAAVRAGGGRVVVAGGCFDLLHAGHVSLLQAARRLGDCLVVALNSDGSVRRLKGAGRPVVALADRVAMLEALSCVDAVAVFDEDSPTALLRALRPHVFAKGGDYSSRRLPEEDVVEAWGGQVVLLPYLSGRSTTGLLGVAAGAR